MKLAIFDLDYTIWQPEMYQIRGPPRLVAIDEIERKKNGRPLSDSVRREALTKKHDHVLIDKNGWLMQMFDGARHALEDIQRLQKDGYPIQAAIASKTDVPEWAYICMEHMILADGTTLIDFFSKDLIEISYGSKYNHIQRLHKTTGIPYNEMCFFDNEYGNVQDVQTKLPDVKCFYTPDGMTKDSWNDSLKHFNMI